MKRFFVFAAIFLVLASCGDPSDETWLKISAIAPPPGATIGVNTNISFKIDYNIATEVLEMDGFIITVSSIAEDNFIIRDKTFKITKRAGVFDYASMGRELYPYNDYDIIKIEVCLYQKDGINIKSVSDRKIIEYQLR